MNEWPDAGKSGVSVRVGLHPFIQSFIHSFRRNHSEKGVET